MTQPPQVPIVPGGYSPPTLSTLMPALAPPPRRSLKWLAWAIPAVVAMAALAVAGVVFGPRLLEGTPLAIGSPEPGPLAVARKDCGSVGTLGDNGKTLALDMLGKESGTGDLSIQQVMCVLNALETPSYVTSLMEKTRAMDGRQSQTWGAFEASWIYHPDNGLDVIIHQVE